MAETSGYGSSAPTLARLGDSCFETTGSRIVGSSEWIVLFWMRWTTLIGEVVDVRVLGEVLKWSGSEEAWPNWMLMSRQLSENVIGTDVW